MARRLQIWLTETQYDALNGEADRTGLPMAELIRRLVDTAMLRHERPRLKGLEVNLGVWRRPDAAVAGRRPGIRLRD